MQNGKSENPSRIEKMMDAAAEADNGNRPKTMSEIARANRSKQDYKPKNYNPADKDQPVNSDSISSIAHMLDKSRKDD